MNLVNRTCRKDFNVLRDESFSTAKLLFPDLSESLDEIRIVYEPHKYHSNYCIKRGMHSLESNRRED